MATHSKRFQAADTKVEAGHRYSIRGGGPARKGSRHREVRRIHRSDPPAGHRRQADRSHGPRSVSLPKGTGKKVRVIAFAQGDMAEKARAAGAVEAGADDLIAKINGGWTDFDVAVAHPELMPKVGRLGRVLGPKGLMPSPKAGTVTENVDRAVPRVHRRTRRVSQRRHRLRPCPRGQGVLRSG